MNLLPTTGSDQSMSSMLNNSSHHLTLAENPLSALNRVFHQWWLRSDGATELARSTDDTGMWLWWFCTLWFVFLMALMVFFVVKYRRRKGKIAPKSAAHNTPLEIAWTVIPTLFLVWIFFKGFWTYMDKVIAPGNAVMMDLKAWKWNWQVTYPNGSVSPATTVIGSRNIPVFYMPADVPVKLRMQSQDVMHAFFVPDFRTKADVFPNRYTTTWFKANKPSGSKTHPKTIAEFESAKASAESKGGRYSGAAYIKELEGVPYEDHWLFCAEYCGDEHSEMAAIIRVVPEEAYRKWLDTIGTGSLPPDELGKRVFQVKGCGQCHTVDGGVSTGPTWKGLFGHAVEFTDGTSYSAEQMSDPAFFANYIRESVLTPSTRIVKGFQNQMTPYQGNITERELEGVIAYITTLSDHPVLGTPAGEPAKAGEPQGNTPAKPATEHPAETPKK